MFGELISEYRGKITSVRVLPLDRRGREVVRVAIVKERWGVQQSK